MIRVAKSTIVPRSLSTTKSYDGEDVKRALHTDQWSKCYLCERKLVTDDQIDHHQSQKNNPGLTQIWDNLFLACSYCNGKKSNDYDDIPNPAAHCIEEEICQRIDFSSKQAMFTVINMTAGNLSLSQLLSKIFNGTNGPRKIKEERFFEYCQARMSHFQDLIVQYLTKKEPTVKLAIEQELAIDRELLGFKYWIIKSNPQLETEFIKYTQWNKQ